MISQLAILPFIFSFIISVAITYITILVYKSLGLVDRSTKKEHPKHIHTIAVPRGGGIPIFLAIFFATLSFLKVDTQIAGIFAGFLGAWIFVPFSWAFLGASGAMIAEVVKIDFNEKCHNINPWIAKLYGQF